MGQLLKLNDSNRYHKTIAETKQCQLPDPTKTSITIISTVMCRTATEYFMDLEHA